MSESPLPAGALTIGATVGNYKILEKIGEGGMGAVYLAAHPLLGRKAAVKVLLPEHSKKADLVNRFFNEAKTAASLRHPALVEVFDFGFLPDGSGYIVMDYLEGESLASRLERVAPLAPEVAAEIARQMAAGVGAAHGQGIVHRDLKPDNVFLVPDPEQADRERVKILDFGIAKLVLPSAPGSKGATSTGMLLGTPLFMAPEQCRGAGQVDHRADIYSVGCILYMMLTGRPPFNHEGIGEILAAHLHEAVTPLRSIDASLPAELEAIVLRALAKRPEDRQQSMGELGAELQGFLYPGAPATGPVHRPSNLMPVPRGSGPQRTAGAPPAAPTPAAQTPVEAASPFAPTPQAPRPAPVVPPARGGRAGVILALVLLAAGGVAGGAWWLGNQWKAKLHAPRRPATATRPPAERSPRPAAPPTTRPSDPAADPAAEPAKPSSEPAAEPTSEPPAVVAEKPGEQPAADPEKAAEPGPPAEPGEQPEPEQPAGTTAPAEPPPKKVPPRPPVARRPSAGARAFARGMEHRGRGEEDLAMYAFEEAISLGGLDAEMRGEAERQYISIKRKYGFIDVQCDERGIDVRVDNRPAGRTPVSRPLLVRPGPHRVELSGGGYQPMRVTVDVGPAQKVGVKCRR